MGNLTNIKKIKQILFVHTDMSELGDLPYCFITLGTNLSPYSDRVIAYYTKEDFEANKGTLIFIDDLIEDFIYEYDVHIIK